MPQHRGPLTKNSVTPLLARYGTPRGARPAAQPCMPRDTLPGIAHLTPQPEDESDSVAATSSTTNRNSARHPSVRLPRRDCRTDTRTPAARALATPAPEVERPSASITAETPAIPLHQTRIFAMAPLRGSLESLERQNVKTEADGLERILDDDLE